MREEEGERKNGGANEQPERHGGSVQAKGRDSRWNRYICDFCGPAKISLITLQEARVSDQNLLD